VENFRRPVGGWRPWPGAQAFINHNCGLITCEITATGEDLPGFGRSLVNVDV
jgi:hypothetical protein